MNVDLIADDQAFLRAVGRVEDERLVAPVSDDAEREPPVTAKVERFEREPLASTLGRVEAVQRKTLRLLRARRRGNDRDEERNEKRCTAARMCHRVSSGPNHTRSAETFVKSRYAS
jgi:hypothetical protein